MQEMFVYESGYPFCFSFSLLLLLSFDLFCVPLRLVYPFLRSPFLNITIAFSLFFLFRCRGTERTRFLSKLLSPVCLIFGVPLTAHVLSSTYPCSFACDPHLWPKGEKGVAQDPFRPSVRRNIRSAISGLRSVRHFAAARREEC